MAQITTIYRDPSNEAFGMKRVDATTGADADPADDGEVLIRLGDTHGSDDQSHKVYLRKAVVCVQGTQLESIVLMSDPYDPTFP